MTNKTKTVLGTILVLTGGALIGWGFRNPEAGHMEPKEVEVKVTLDQLPPAVRARVDMETKGATLKSIEKESKGDAVTYDVEFMRGTTKIEIDVREDGTIAEREVRQRKRSTPKAGT